MISPLILLLGFFVGPIWGGCFNGSIEWQSDCYYFVANATGFAKAEFNCNKLGGYLTSIHDGYDNAFLARN